MNWTNLFVEHPNQPELWDGEAGSFSAGGVPLVVLLRIGALEDVARVGGDVGYLELLVADEGEHVADDFDSVGGRERCTRFVQRPQLDDARGATRLPVVLEFILKRRDATKKLM